jgi:hypothetical protein
MPLAQGQVLENRYRVVSLLGQGGMGAVYRAWDVNLNKPVAVKENLDISPEAQRQFQHEAQILSNLSHPNLPRVTDHFFIHGQGQYLVMDFVDGEDLQAMLDRTGHPLAEPQVLPWIEQVCDALHYLHTQNPPIIHRDIKPANIKVTPQGRAVLVDFGISKIFDSHLKTTVGARAVTPGYSPPEQYSQGVTDERSDIYALGATLYTLLTGHAPPESVECVANNAALIPPRQLAPSISPRIEATILCACQTAKTARFQDVIQFQQALLPPPMLPQQPVAVSHPATGKRVSVPAWVFVITGLGGILLVAALMASNSIRPVATLQTVAITPLYTFEVTANMESARLTATPTFAPLPTITQQPGVATATLVTPTIAPTPTLTPTSNCPAVGRPFAAVWQTVQSKLGCASNEAHVTWLAEEFFEHGLMYWRKDTNLIYVIFNGGKWGVYANTWKEGDPGYSCGPESSPPTPQMGFGRVWCDTRDVRSGLGNALTAEGGADGTVQDFERGFIFQTSAGAMYVLYAGDGWERPKG